MIEFLYRYARSLSDDSRKRLRTLGKSRFRWLVNAFAFLFRRDLKKLAIIYGSDKWKYHWYAQHYEHHFAPIRYKKINLLEIGIGGYENPNEGGNSLRMWRAYFPRARVYGLDLYDKTAHNERRIKTFVGDQMDTAFLDSVVEQIGRIDVIVDDGSHITAHVLVTFRHLFPVLADGGFYVVEDIETPSWPTDEPANEHNDPQTSLAFFKSLVYGLNHDQFRSDYQPSYFDTNIMSICFYHNLVVIKKSKDQR